MVLSPSILRSTVFTQRTEVGAPVAVPFARRLIEHCENVLAGRGGHDLVVNLELRIDGACPKTHENTVMRVADELLSNAMEHGFHGRTDGQVFVHIGNRSDGAIQVSVSDDGWGFDDSPVIDGNGYRLLRLLGDLNCGVSAGLSVAGAVVTVVIPAR